jgi:anti-anti-sigma factor
MMIDVLEHGETVDGQSGIPVLTVELVDTETRYWLTLRGDLTGASIAALETQVDQIGCSDCKEVLLDVTGLKRLDSIGLRVLIGIDQYVEALGGRLRILGASGEVAEALSPTSLHLLHVSGDIA